MKHENLIKYLEIEAEFKRLEAEKAALRQIILNDMKASSLKTISDPVLGSFTVASKTSWTYTPAITKLEDKVKIAKDKEQKKGIAKASMTEYLVYKASNGTL